MKLYRIIAEEDWKQSKKEGKVPRCNSDKRAGHVHLNKFEDIKTVADKYFEHSENPLVIEMNVSLDLEKKISWETPNSEKNWKQAHLQIENIDMKNVERFSFLKHIDGGKFDLREFIVLEN